MPSNDFRIPQSVQEFPKELQGVPYGQKGSSGVPVASLRNLNWFSKVLSCIQNILKGFQGFLRASSNFPKRFSEDFKSSYGVFRGYKKFRCLGSYWVQTQIEITSPNLYGFSFFFFCSFGKPI